MDRLHPQEIAVDKIELNMCSSNSGSPGRSSHQADVCFDKPQLCPLSHSSLLEQFPHTDSTRSASAAGAGWIPLGGCARAGRIQPDRGLHGKQQGKVVEPSAPAARSTAGRAARRTRAGHPKHNKSHIRTGCILMKRSFLPVPALTKTVIWFWASSPIPGQRLPPSVPTRTLNLADNSKYCSR